MSESDNVVRFPADSPPAEYERRLQQEERESGPASDPAFPDFLLSGEAPQ